MPKLKRGATGRLFIEHDLNLDEIESVKFLFKQRNLESAPELVTKVYPGEVTSEGGVFTIPFSEEETRLFRGGESFYCDPKPFKTDGESVPVEVIEFFLVPTLWGDSDA